MKLKLSFVVLICIITASVNAQFFSTLKKPHAPYFSIVADSISTAFMGAVASDVPVTKNEFRPIINVFSSAIQLNSKASQQASISALTGGGVSYQHLIYDAAKDRWNAQWSVNALAWYSTNMAGDQSKVFMYGLALGLLNNNILVGAATDGGGKFAVTAGFGINFNN